MKIVKDTTAEQVIFTLIGKLDTNTAPELEKEINGLKTEQLHKLIFDITELSYVSSAGLRIILMSHKKMLGLQGQFTVMHPTPMVEEVFEMTGFSDILDIIK